MKKIKIWLKWIFIPLIYSIFHKIDMSDIEKKAKEFALKSHRKTNHKYDIFPYKLHLNIVVWFARKYIYLIPIDKRNNVLAACWCHDTIEDCRVTYNDIKNTLGDDVANIVYALTNDKGKNRKERAGDNYYKGISIWYL